MNDTKAGTATRRTVLKGGLATSMVAALGLGAPILAGTRRAAAMAGTQTAAIDPATVQVLFADLQEAIVAGSATATPEEIGRSSSVLAKVATILDLPMLFSVVPEGSNPPSMIPELRPYATQSNTILRTLAGPFMDEPTTKALAENGRKTLLITGYAAEVVVLQATLDAIAAGYTVHYVVDAIGALSSRTEDAAFREMERAGAIPASVLSLVTRMTPNFFEAPGSETFGALGPLLGR